MNKYILPLVIIVGLVIITIYPQLNKTDTKKAEDTTSISKAPTTSVSQDLSVSPVSTASSVPVLKDENVIKTFFTFIDEKKIPEAIDIMSKNIIGNESSKQAWGTNFNSIKSVTVKAIEPALQDSWTEIKKEYKVSLEMQMDPNSENAPIPYYGWDNGDNTRWITIQKTNGLWQIAEIATSP